MKSSLFLCAATLALAACGSKTDTTIANVNDTTVDNMAMSVNDTAAMTGTPSTADFVTKAANSDMYEVEAGKLAKTMATDAALRKFGGDMVDAHTATTAGLKAAIAKEDPGVKPPAAMDGEHQAMIDALKTAKGADFDTLYRSQQADAHGKALELMKGYAVGGDNAALKAFAADTAPKVQMHIDMLHKLGG